MNSPSSELKPSESKLKKAARLFKRFSAGAAVGLGMSAIYWGYAEAWHPQSLAKGVVVSLVLASIFGGLTAKWGYTILQDLWESINLP